MQASEAPWVELRKAQEAIEEMKLSKDLDSFEESWKSFLGRLERVSNKTQSHYKKSPKWGPWWGPWKKRKEADDLLMYLTNARGADEHSVDSIVSRSHGGIGINPAQGNSLYIEHMHVDGQGNIFIQSPDELKIECIAAKMTLLDITNRGRVYHVPREHLGKAIDPSDVIAIANLGAQFHEDMLLSAEAYFVK
jgi:hypothetical protein